MALYALGFTPSKEDLNKLIGDFDKDKSGRIDFAEFLDIMITKMSEKDSAAELEKAFLLFDLDGDKKISFDDLKQVAKQLNENLTDEELREMLAAGGSSKDKDKPAKDYVTDREFFAILNKGNT